MSIYSAMNSGVSGLAAQSAKFAAISDNISNSSTVGYKRTGVQFATLVTSASAPNSYSAGGVQADLRTEVSKGGLVQSTTQATDLAISGNGFFVVSDSATAGTTGAKTLLTRAGSFHKDENGNLVNTAGYYLQGWRLDASGKVLGGEPSRTSFDSMQTVNLSEITGLAQATSTISFAGNLPASQTGKTPAAAPFSTSLDYFTPLGFTSKLTLQWQPSSTANAWTLNILDANNASVGTVDLTFSDGVTGTVPGGALTAMTGSGGATVNGGTISIDVGGQPIDINMGAIGAAGGLTQFGDEYSPSKINKDGAAYGQLDRVEVGDNGIVTAIYSNGLRQAVYQLPLATVINPDGLSRADGNAYQISRNSGDVYLWDAGTGSAGTVNGSALEASNVDIAEELTSIIETQRAYSSNAKIIQTADEMMDEITRLMR